MSIFFQIIFFTAIMFIEIYLRIANKHKHDEVFKGQLSQSSFQKYAKFYDETLPKDVDFHNKMNKIYNMIEIDKKTDIKKIAEKAGCSYEECILKIRYLKNKGKIGNCYIDHKNGEIRKCTEEELKLINKYKPYIYFNHLSLEEIVLRLPGTTNKNREEIEEKVYEEIKQLYEKDLLINMKINDVDKKLIYFTDEKSEKEKDFISISCENCGAINDVNRGNKTRCEYCGTIIEDKINEK